VLANLFVRSRTIKQRRAGMHFNQDTTETPHAVRVTPNEAPKHQNVNNNHSPSVKDGGEGSVK
jgi:hypothetical protein